jgi:hypothetical protein
LFFFPPTTYDRPPTVFTIHHSELPQPEHLSPGTCTSDSCIFHNPTYYPSLSSAVCQETKCPRGAGAAMVCPRLPCSYGKATSGRRLGLVSSASAASPKGRDKVAGGNAPGKRAPNKARP